MQQPVLNQPKNPVDHSTAEHSVYDSTVDPVRPQPVDRRSVKRPVDVLLWKLPPHGKPKTDGRNRVTFIPLDALVQVTSGGRIPAFVGKSNRTGDANAYAKFVASFSEGEEKLALEKVDAEIRALVSSLTGISDESTLSSAQRTFISKSGTWPSYFNTSVDESKRSSYTLLDPCNSINPLDANLELSDLANRAWSLFIFQLLGVYVKFDENGLMKSFGPNTRLKYLQLGENSTTSIDVQAFSIEDARLTPIESNKPGVELIGLGCKDGPLVLSFNGGGKLPPFAIATDTRGGTDVIFSFNLDDQKDDEAARAVQEALVKSLLENRKSWHLSDTTSSQEVLRSKVQPLVSDRKTSPSGSFYPAVVKARIVPETEAGASVFVDSSGTPVTVDKLSSGIWKWIRVDVVLKSVFIQRQAIGFSRRVGKVVVEQQVSEDDCVIEPIGKRQKI